MGSTAVYKKRKTLMDNYVNIIFKMLKDGIPTEVVYGYVCHCGYDGKPTTLLPYIETVRRNNFPDQKARNPMQFMQHRYPEGVEVASRSAALKYVFTCNEKTPLNAKLGEHIGAIKAKYPVLAECEKVFRAFHKVIMGDSPEALDTFLNTYRDSSFKPFCSGIEMDITPVRNAITYSVSSGFVEGCNNKFKVIKRNLYGRALLAYLFMKCRSDEIVAKFRFH
jgi:hypothetical protein